MVQSSRVAVVLFGAMASVALAQPAPTVDELRRQLEGSFVGATTCGSRTPVEVRITKVEPAGSWLQVQGTLKATPQEGGKANPFEIGLTGQFDIARPMLAANWQFEVNANPSCVLTIGGRCVMDEGAPALLKNIVQKRRAELARRAAFQLLALPDADGQGWQGTLRGASTDCPGLALRRVGAPAAPAAAPVPLEKADQAIAVILGDTVRYGTEGQALAHWLTPAAGAGDTLAQNRLGQLFEAGAVGLPADPKKALEHYQRAADAGHAGAQLALARLLDAGVVVPLDAAASERWKAAARVTRDAASRVCSAPAAVRAYYELVDRENNAPMSQVAGALAQALMGVRIEPGTYAFIAASSEAVGTLDRPFRCIAVARRSGMRMTSVAPDFVYAGDDEDGDPLYRDNRAEAAVNEAIGNTVAAMANAMPMVATFTLAPLGGTRYRVTSRQDLQVSAAPLSTEVDIGAPARPAAAAVPPAARPQALAPAQQAIARPSAPPPPAPPPAPPRPVAAAAPDWDATQVLAAVDRSFVQWSSAWFVDRYIVGSAQITVRECQPDHCQYGGRFQVLRGGAPVVVQFVAVVMPKPNGEAGVARLCYQDASTGMRDCNR